MKEKKNNIILRVLVCSFTIYAIFTLVSLQLRIGNQQKEVDLLESKLSEQRLINTGLNDLISGEINAEFMEQVARDRLGLAYPDEWIFVNPNAKK
jgi:cell division protein FtsB